MIPMGFVDDRVIGMYQSMILLPFMNDLESRCRHGR